MTLEKFSQPVSLTPEITLGGGKQVIIAGPCAVRISIILASDSPAILIAFAIQ